jgi:NitT/TauT family transport system permease protein
MTALANVVVGRRASINGRGSSCLRLPFVVSGMKQGWAFAWRSLMRAEIFVTILTGFGLGHLLKYGRELSAMDQVIGVMVVIVVIGLIADKILFSPWERFLHRRWGTGLE